MKAADDEKDIYENSYYHFVEAVKVLAATAEESCERLGNFNVAFETKYDVEAGPYLFNYPACPLSSEQRNAIVELVESLKSIPESTLEFTKAPSVSLERMRDPAWVSPRDKAVRLLLLLQPITELNEQYLWPNGK